VPDSQSGSFSPLYVMCTANKNNTNELICFNLILLRKDLLPLAWDGNPFILRICWALKSWPNPWPSRKKCKFCNKPSKVDYDWLGPIEIVWLCTEIDFYKCL